MTERCSCCDLLIESCGRRARPIAASLPFEQPDSTRPASRPFPASYPGKCVCGEDFEPGDEVCYDEDNDLVLVGCCG
jgi:hypothetical protein